MEIDFLKMNQQAIQSTNKRLDAKPANNLDKAAKSFADFLEEQVEWVRENQSHSKNMVKKFAMGEVENIHDVIIAGEKASLAMNTMNTIRKKLLEAYREVESTRL